MKNDDPFPKLTVLPDSPAPAIPRLTMAEKYGSLYWLGISGLVFSIGLMGWFGWNLVAMRHVWRAVFVLHDTRASDMDRLAAANVLLSDPRVQPSQIQPMLFRPMLPDKARYSLAEGMERAVSQADARQMLAVLATKNATSPPNWLRGHLARLAALTIPAGPRFPAGAFRELIADDDPIVADWAAFALIIHGDPADKLIGGGRLEKRAGEGSALAAALVQAVRSDMPVETANRARGLMRTETAGNRSIMGEPGT